MRKKISTLFEIKIIEWNSSNKLNFYKVNLCRVIVKKYSKFIYNIIPITLIKKKKKRNLNVSLNMKFKIKKRKERIKI